MPFRVYRKPFFDLTGETAYPAFNAYSPGMCCGFECGLSNNGSNAHIVGGSSNIQSAVARNGGSAYRLQIAGFPAGFRVDPAKTSSLWVGRAYLRFQSFPGVDTILIWSGKWSSNSGLGFGVAYRPSTGKIHTWVDDSSGPVPFSGLGADVVADKWYCVDYKFDRINGTVDARIREDGSGSFVDLAYTYGVVTNPSLQVDLLNHGSQIQSFGHSHVMFYDDLITSYTASDYLFQTGNVRILLPYADGVHNTGGAGRFRRNLAGIDIVNATTDSYQLIDDPGLSGSDWITQYGGGNTNYVEHLLTWAGGFVPTVNPRAVDAIIAHGAQNNLSASSKFKIVDNNIESSIKDFSGVSGGTEAFRKQFANPPSGFGGWKRTGINGNINLLRDRFGYFGGTGPAQFCHIVGVEVEFPGAS